MMQVPVEFQTSKGLQYILSKGWQWKQSDSERIQTETCPVCKKAGWGHFYMVCEPGKRDGLWQCMRCGKSGHLNALKEEMGDKIQYVGDFGTKGDSEQMPNIEQMHEELLANEDAMDYLVNTRGFSLEIIKQQKIGFGKRFFKKLGGEKLCISYPYLIDGNAVFVHWRTLPPTQKEFSSLKGWEAPLYNGHILNDESLKEVSFVEGEANVIAALDHGVKDIVGVPGANFKKAMWLEQLDKIEELKIYICYDKDQVGQKAAQTLASRIGINRCYKIILPDFEIPSDEGGTKKGKDLNEWFQHGGGSAEKWETLKAQAPKFDVDGVTNIDDGLDRFEEELNGKTGMMPKYMMPWPSLGDKLGLEEGDILDIIAYEKIGKTTFGLNLMEYFVDQYGEDGIIICLEMSNDRMIRKWVSHVSQVADKVTFDPVEAAALNEKFKEGVKVARAKHHNRPGNLYFCYPKGVKTLDDFFKLVTDCIRRYGVKWIMVDNLQLLAGRVPRGTHSRMEHLDRISKGLQGLNKDYGTQMIRILQPHRNGNDELCTMNDVDGSASLAKDCDAGISLNRSKKPEMSSQALATEGMVMSSDASFDRKLLVTVDITRYSAGGQCTLDYVGETSTVREYNHAQIKAEEAKIKSNILNEVKDVSQLTTSAGTEGASAQSEI
ncbi:MAG: hypothetical protein C5B59_06695 [Bacteroidetes bacterium]|nr:MAG: hypothetical protein C5B59_06695 [Bacteroidota bacterium]